MTKFIYFIIMLIAFSAITGLAISSILAGGFLAIAALALVVIVAHLSKQ